MRLNRATWPIALALRGAGRRVRFPGRERLLRAAFHPDRQDDFRFEVDLDGLVYAGRADSFIDWNVLFHGLYEADDVRLLQAIAGRLDRPVFLDVGANTGHHSLVMAACCRAVHAFEPDAGAREVLGERIVRNGLGNVVVHDCALGEDDGTARLYTTGAPAYPGASLVAGANDLGREIYTEVRVRNGDRYLAERGIDRVDMVKIDVEGFELPVLRGLRRVLERDRPVLLVENSEAGRWRLADLAAFAAAFPPDYGFYAARRGPTARPIGADDYRNGGNVFCVAAEKARLMESARGNE